MHHYGFLILLLCYNVLCISEECVTYNFEDNDKANFTNTYGICQGMCTWDVREYSLSSINSPHRNSHVFITPRTTLSCISSFKFTITGSGLLELNVFMAPSTPSDQITLLVFQSLPGANDATVGNAVLSPNDISFVPGWQTMRIHIAGIGTHEGYITLLGMAAETSTILVDSFRYVAPTYDIDACKIYPDDESTTEIPRESTTIIPITTEIPTKSTLEILSTTEEPTTVVIPTKSTPEILSTTEEPTTVAIPTKSTPEILSTTVKPTTVALPTKSTTEIPIPTILDVDTTTVDPSTSTIPATSTTAIPVTTTTKKPSTIITIPIISTTVKPSTITIPTESTTEKTSTTTAPTIITTEKTTTEKITTPTPSTTVTTSTTTARPRLFVSILLVKIKKFFR